MWQNLTTWSQKLYFPTEGKYAQDFYRPSKSIASAESELANLGSNGKHTSHYNTEATIKGVRSMRLISIPKGA
jgi:hypothetical protein